MAAAPFDKLKFLANLSMTKRYGIYHVTNEGEYVSWYDFAKEIFRISGIEIPVFPIESSQYPTRALRPKNSVMSKDSIDQNGFMRLPNWKDALERYLKEIEVI